MRKFIANKVNLFTLCFFLGFLLLCILFFILSVSTATLDGNGEVYFQPLLITFFSVCTLFTGISFLAFLILLIIHIVRRMKAKKKD